MEWREPFQTDEHCSIGVNVDPSRSLLEGRRPMHVLASTNIPRRARLHVTYSPSGEQWVLAVGLDDGASPTAVRFACYDLAGIVQGTVHDLTSSFGELATVDFDCSFVDQTLSVGGNAHHVTLIVTLGTTYVFDAAVSLTLLRKLNTAKAPTGDTPRMNDVNFGYVETVPRGRIAIEHQGRVYYAGFRPGTDFQYSSTLEASQNLVPEAIVKNGGGLPRSVLGLGPQHVVYSDEFDPAGVQIHHVFSVEEHEKVTGLVSFQERLVIFTDRSIYVMNGGTDESFQISKVVSGVGCVAPHSVVEVNGNLLWLSHDGVWGWAGGAVPQKLTAGIDALFTGRYDKTFVPETVGSDTLGNLGWPWTVRWNDLYLCQSMLWREGRQVWWSLPIQSRAYMSFPVTLVYDWETNGFTAFSMSPTTNSDASCMFDGVTVPQQNGRELVLTSAGVTHQWLQTPNVAALSDVAAGRGVPVVWASGRIDKPNDAKTEYRKVRLKMLSRAKIPAATPPQFFVWGGEAHHDIGNAVRQEQSGSLTLHPDDTKTYFWDTAVWDTAKWAEADWFTSNLKSSIRSRWLGWGFVDDPHGTARPPLVAIQSWSVEVLRGQADE